LQHNTLPVGTIIRTSNRDRYMVERLLGKGGLSAIYLVRDQRVKQNHFALKEVKNPSRREREHFLFECDVLKRLDHQALPRVYRVFEDPEHNQAYVLMDYIEGPNLERLRRQQPKQRFSVPQVLSMMDPIVDAVAFLHSQFPPVIHRDIKPSNIIVPAAGDDAVLVDFSIAKAYASEETTTAVGQGTPGYAAPEQYGMGTTPRTDIYGLGATMYTLLTGTTPADALYRMLRTSEMNLILSSR
jgi:serine/threonine protein kinase